MPSIFADANRKKLLREDLSIYLHVLHIHLTILPAYQWLAVAAG